MMTTMRSFWNGWRAATALWPVVLLLYLVDTAFAAVLVLPAAAELSRVFGSSAMASELLGPVSLDWLNELFYTGDGFSYPWLLLLLVPMSHLLVGTFLRGGTLGVLAQEDRPFRWPWFFSDCARFFGGFLLLLLFFVPGLVAVVVLFFLGSLLLGLVPVSGQGELVVNLLRLALFGLLGALLLTAMDYARISLVLEPERSHWRHVGRALRFVVLRFPQVVLLGLGFALAGWLIGAAYPVLLQQFPAFGVFLPALILQQLTVLLAALHRVAMLAGETALYRSR